LKLFRWMMIHALIAPLVFLTPGAAIPVAEAQGGGTNEPAVAPPSTGTRQRSKLESNLAAVATTFLAQGEAAARDVARDRRIPVEQAMARIEIVANAPNRAGVAGAVAGAGGKVEAEYANLTQALVPFGALDRLAADASVRVVRDARRPELNAITGEEVAALGANTWAGAGLNGAGVKVAVVDFGFTGYAAAQAAGELPAGGQLVVGDFCEGNANAAGREHGTATAQIVHEVAPGAQLYLLCVSSLTQLGNAVTYAYGQGVTILSESASWYNYERGDGTGGPGTPHGIATDARNHGILWSESSGNRQQTHWSGVFNDSDGDDAHNFTAGDEGLTVTIPADYGYCAYLKWDRWPTTDQDFDLYLVQSSTGTLVAASINDQTGTQTPTEAICYTNSTGSTQNFNYQIHRFNGTSNPVFDLFGHNAPSFEYKTPAGSVTEPATSPNVMGVGAVCWQNNALETYSSLGPTIDGRVKPDVVAQDSVSGAVYGNFTTCGSSGFAGTSASAPAAAGAAALIKQAFPTYGPAEIRDVIVRRAVDQGAPSFDNSFGAGRVLLGSVIQPCTETASRFCLDARTAPPGKDTGLDVVSGQRLIVSATGRGWYGFEGAAGCLGYPETDVDGVRSLPTGACSPKVDGNAQLPTSPIGALIARIGSGPWFFVGDSFNQVVTSSGRLRLLYNELFWTDDLGIYTVNVTLQNSVSCSPRPPVTTQTTLDGSRLKVTIGATGAGNTVSSIQFTKTDEALLDLPDGRTGVVAPQSYSPPSPTSTVSYWIRRKTPGLAATARMTINDGCGTWNTFAGAGTGVII
jgi:hypothetical protein